MLANTQYNKYINMSFKYSFILLLKKNVFLMFIFIKSTKPLNVFKICL